MNFLRNILSTFTAMAIFLLLILICVVSIFSSADDLPEVKDRSILHIKLKKTIVDRPHSSEFNFANSAHCGDGLLSIQKAINHAKADTGIKAIYLELGDLKGSLANVLSLKRSFKEFKKTGKKVIVYSDGLSQIGYHLATSGDSIFVDNLSHVEWKGLSAQLMYFKSMLDKLGVKAEPIRVGRYKSAIEPFVMDSISPENELQVKEMLNDIWETVCFEVAEERNISTTKLNEIADELGYLMPKEAVVAGLIDGIKYEDELHEYFRELVNGKPNFISVKNYNSATEVLFQLGKKIVVVNAEGAIVDSPSETDVSSVKYCKIFDDILKDNNVEAVVLRVNSPGGSALASEKMWRKLKLIQQKMPLIVSMGNVAASGGYYMAAAGDTILAEKNTITGSIGVFGLMFNVSKLTNRMGINVEKVKTNELSDFPSFDRNLSNKEKNRVIKGINSVYGTFIKRVSEGRDLSEEDVHKLAEGRVWTGKQAFEIGLVDSLGGLEEAIGIAASAASLKEFKLVHLPKEQTPIEALVKHFSDQSQMSLPEPFSQYNYILQNPNYFNSFSKPQVRLPFVLSID